MSVAILIPSMGKWEADMAMCLVGMLGSSQTKIERVISTEGTLIAQARTKLAKEALQTPAEYFLWIDSDTVFPADTMDRLYAHQKPFVAASLPTRRLPLKTNAIKDSKRLMASGHQKGLERVDAIGLALALTHRSIFEKLNRPWFDCVWIMEGGEEVEFVSEDVYFTLNAAAAGFDILVDHDLSKQSQHIGTCAYSHANMDFLNGVLDYRRS